jgi:cyclopropane-fatty-acyl-phospholipid synthase
MSRERLEVPEPVLPRPLHGLARRAVQALLGRLSRGTLHVLEDGRRATFRGERPLAATDLEVTVRVRDPRAWAQVATRGTVGFGEAYIRGDFECDDLVGLVRLFVQSQAVMGTVETGLARLTGPLHRLYHRLRDNDRSGSRQNIAAHYDLGNELYALFLDPTLSYSCGIFEEEGSTLEEASIAKIDRACQKLGLRAEHHLLEIGTGWGALAIHAAREYGCRVTTTTISAAQHEVAVERVKAAGLEERVTCLREDYRDLRGTYDRLVSIEMVEAVGAPHLPEFFRALDQRLAPDGLALLQAITIREQAWARSLEQIDFVKRWIFPGSDLLSLQAISTNLANQTSLSLTHLEDITPHYARTLRAWRQRFHERLPEVRALGYGERFIRLWDFYLAYCEAGFEDGYVRDVQVLLAKPEHRTPAPLGELRARALV